MRSRRLFVIALLVGIVISNRTLAVDHQCIHQDGRWEHRVDSNGNLDVAVTTRNGNGHIWLGGAPGKLQMIKIDNTGRKVKKTIMKGPPAVFVAEVTLSSDVSEAAKTLAFYDEKDGGTLVIPVPNLLAVLLRSKTLTVSVPQISGSLLTYSEDVSDIPLGTGHRCGPQDEKIQN